VYLVKAYCANLNFFKKQIGQQEFEIKLYRTVIRPIVTCASETWVLKESVIQKQLVFERKSLRRIFGPTKENQIWRVKTNEELDQLIRHKNIINYIKAERLSWFGHVQRIADTRRVKKIFNWNSLTKRSQGRLKHSWEDDIKQDICQLKNQNWIDCVQDRGK
jgi:capsule polysaccharide modification protein KpsS